MLRRSYELCLGTDSSMMTAQMIEGLYRQPDLFMNYLRVFLQSHIVDDGNISPCAKGCSRISADATGLCMQRKYVEKFEAPWAKGTIANQFLYT